MVCLVVDATGPIGPGDRFVAEQMPADAIVIVAPVDPPPAAVLTEFMRRGGRVLVADDDRA